MGEKGGHEPFSQLVDLPRVKEEGLSGLMTREDCIEFSN